MKQTENRIPQGDIMQVLARRSKGPSEECVRNAKKWLEDGTLARLAKVTNQELDRIEATHAAARIRAEDSAPGGRRP